MELRRASSSTSKPALGHSEDGAAWLEGDMGEREKGTEGGREQHFPVPDSSKMLVQLTQTWEGSPEADAVSSASRSRRWAGEGSPSPALPGAAADALGQKCLQVLQLQVPDAARLQLNRI